jgi:hypothetical protein
MSQGRSGWDYRHLDGRAISGRGPAAPEKNEIIVRTPPWRFSTSKGLFGRTGARELLEARHDCRHVRLCVHRRANALITRWDDDPIIEQPGFHPATSDGLEAEAPWGKGVRRATVPGAPG